MLQTHEITALLETVFPIERIRFQESMRNHTSFCIGGPTDFLIEPHSTRELASILPLLKHHSVPVTVIGNGSNLLVRDKGIRGIVLKIAQNFGSCNVEGTVVTAEAGILLSRLSSIIASKSLKGFEFASGIPGTLGGALYMNAGAYGGEMSQVVKSVDIINSKGELQTLSREDLQFAYRKSFLNTQVDAIAVQGVLELKPGVLSQIQKHIKELTFLRTSKQPVSARCAGSTFKRPTGFYAGKLIQDCGLRGFRIGDAMVSNLHTGFVINTGNASAENILELIHKIQEKVQAEFGVFLEPEVKILGEA